MSRRKAYGKGHIEQVGRNKWAIELSGGRDPRTGTVYHVPSSKECPGVIYTHEIPPKALAVSRITKKAKGGEEKGVFYRRVRPMLRFGNATNDEQGMHFWQIPVVYLRAYETVLGTKREAELRVEEMRIELEILGDLLEAGIDEKDIATQGLCIRGARESHMGASDLIEEYERRIAEAGISTFAQWCESYLSTREKTLELRESTCKADRFYSKHLLDGLGSMKLTEIRAKDVKNLYADMKVAGVGPSTIWHCHKLLKAILNDALANELIIRNPVDSVKAPKRPKPKRRSLTADQARRLRDIASKRPLGAYRVAVYLGLAIGARLGEVLGLQWKHIVIGDDEDFPYIDIVQQYLGRGKTGPLKTDEDGNPVGRKVPLDASTSALLEEWKIEQLAALSALGLEQRPDTPIVTSGSGTYADRHNFSTWFRSWCADNGFGHWEDDEGRRIVDLEYGSDDASLYDGCVIVWRDASGWPCDENGRRYSRSYRKPVLKRHYRGLVFHELRHTHFTLRLDNGTSVPVAMALGGWKSSRMLYETYIHATPEKIWDEEDFMDSVLSTPKNV